MSLHLPRLDILLYAHDGRGLGHASRTIAIGMALRRLHPECRVLFVSGCRMSQDLIDSVPLDWLKLPAYETKVVDGVSQGADGGSGYSDRQLGALRAQTLAQIVELYRPKLVLCDHSPQGKHRELVPAQEAGKAYKTVWVLGSRGVIGGVNQVRSDLARRIFADHYQEILWYGDSRVLGSSHLRQLQDLYGQTPKECGYVSRLTELNHWQGHSQNEGMLAGTVAIPWRGEHSDSFLRILAEAMAGIDPDYGIWQFFIDIGRNPAQQAKTTNLFAQLPHCHLDMPSGRKYLLSLFKSRTALVYGGYNSVVDVLAAGIPAIVVLRAMQDNEQQIHLQHLLGSVGNRLQVVAEETTDVSELRQSLLAALATQRDSRPQVNLAGAETAAGLLYQLLVNQQHQGKGKKQPIISIRK